jgi:LVIVD repeat
MRWLLGAACTALLLAAPAASRPSGAVLDRFDLVGHVAFAGGIESADVWAHGAYAYVGSSCGSERRGAGGVRIVDISRPSRPRVVGRLANDAFTRAEDVVVRHIRTAAFDGDLAVVGIQACLGSGQEHIVRTGLRFFDVTHPRHPGLIGIWLLPPGAIGCHEVDLAQRPDGHVLAGCARQLQDQVEGSTNTELPGGVQIVDATDPVNPVSRAAWQLPLDSTIGIGCLPIRFAHSIRFVNGGLGAYVSYWDAGTVRLDLTNPAAPAVLGVTRLAPPDEDGDNHSMTLANRSRWLVINQEDLSPSGCEGNRLGGWGNVWVFDAGSSKLVGQFSTRDSRSTRADGNYTVHNTEVALDRQFFSSWYSDGIVWWTMNDRGAARQLGRFTPPAGPPFGVPLVWGVDVDHLHHLILASDMGSGLWLVRPRGLTGL